MLARFTISSAAHHHALQEAAHTIPYLDAMTTQGVPSDSDKEVICEEIDKLRRRALIGAKAESVLRQIYGIEPLA